MIIGLYVVLWGKARDLEETNEEANLRNDESGNVNILIDNDSSSEQIHRKVDLEEPLMSHKSTNDEKIGI